MPPLLFRCPNTGLPVRGFIVEITPNDDSDSDLPVRCLSCHQMHLVGLKTGKITDEYEALCGLIGEQSRVRVPNTPTQPRKPQGDL